MIVTRDALKKDVSEILDIYAYYVENSLSTFEEKVPSELEILQKMQDDFPFIVAIEGETIVGFAYAFTYRRRTGYRYTVEESIYVKDGNQGKGIGKILLNSLISKLGKFDYKQILAVITIPYKKEESTVASVMLHESCGFEKVGRLTKVGYKFDQWMDTILMQHSIK